VALEKNQLDAAARLFQEVRQLAPDDSEAEAGIKIVDKLKSGALTPEMLKKKMEQNAGNKGDVLGKDKASGKTQWAKTDLAKMVAQLEQKPGAVPAPGVPAPGGPPNQNPALEQDLLQAHRDRVIIEEQKMTQAVEAAVQMARKDLGNDPDGVLEVLRGLLARVKDHPDLGEKVRGVLISRLDTSLREA